MANNNRREDFGRFIDPEDAAQAAPRPPLRTGPGPALRDTAFTARQGTNRGHGRGRGRGYGPVSRGTPFTARRGGRSPFMFGAPAEPAREPYAWRMGPGAAVARPRRGNLNRRRPGVRGGLAPRFRADPARNAPTASRIQFNIKGMADRQRALMDAATASQRAPIEPTAANPNILRAWKLGKDAINGDPPDAYVGVGNRLASDGTLPFWYRYGIADSPDIDVKQRTTNIDRQAWLGSMPRWINKLGDGWIGKKILGMGTFGIAGLWERNDDILVNGDVIRKVVVKQSGGSPGVLWQLKNEGMWLKRFRGTGTEHVVKMYADVHFEAGQGTITRLEYDERIDIDSTTEEIGRLYLEFCEGGDFKSYIKEMYNKYSASNPMPEELIWHVFKCFALGLMVMENGQERISGGSWAYEVVHMDLKPENLLVGSFGPTHTKTPPVKLADFGASLSADDPQNQIDGHRRGTPIYRGPEQYDHNYPAAIKRAGTPLNTWAFAKTLYLIITRGRQFSAKDASKSNFKAEVGPENEVIQTMGIGLLQAPYSVLLRKTVLRCLAYDLTKRPTPRELLRLIEEVLEDLGDTGGSGDKGGNSGKPQPDDGADLPDYIDPDDMTVVGPIPPFDQAGNVAPAAPVPGQGDRMQGVKYGDASSLDDFTVMIEREREEEAARIEREMVMRARAGGFP